MALDVEDWLRQCSEAYDFDIRGVFRRHGSPSWGKGDVVQGHLDKLLAADVDRVAMPLISAECPDALWGVLAVRAMVGQDALP